MSSAILAPRGNVTMRVNRAPADGLRGFLSHALPWPGLGREVNMWRLRNLPRLLRQFLKVAVGSWIAKRCGLVHGHARLHLRVTRATGVTLDYGIGSYRVVTDTGVGFIVDGFQNLVELENMKYHGYGTASTAEAAGDTALAAELSTQYATDSTRPTGTTTEGATGNIYRTVATLDPDAAVAITEHGIFSQAATGGGVLLDRSIFSAINLAAAGDTLQSTYDLTLTSGS